MNQLKKQSGFTIVELLVVIVVIGILAAVTIVAYNGIQARARASNVQSSLAQVNKKLAAYAVDNSAYPATLSAAGINDTATTYQYSYNNSVNPATYCVTATNGTTSYKADSAATQPVSGGCAGHGTGGVPPVTNLVINPSFETGQTNWNSYTFGTDGIGVTSRPATGGYSGTSFLRGTFSTAATAGFLSIKAQTALGPDLIAGQVVATSLYVRPSITVNINAGIDFYIKSGATYVSLVNGTSVSCPANVWTRVSVSGTVPATATTARSFASAVASSFGSTGTLDIDGVILTEGSTTIYNYGDGTSANWIWNGTAHSSTSVGPAL